MTKGNFFKYYNKLSGCDGYFIFFKYADNIYMAKTKHIAPRWTHEERESTKKGGWQKWRMGLSVADKKQLVSKGAECVMSAESFERLPYANKGHKCEYYLHERFELGEYKPDNKRFDKCGDVRIDGVEYQVKFENATLTNVNVLHKAQKDARMKKVA